MAKLTPLLMTTALTLASPASAESVSLNLDLTDITVSGLSSGGYMATQYHIANSDVVSGAAVIAGGPYYCAQNSITTALSQCVNKVEPPIDINTLNQYTEGLAKNNAIAPLSNLRDDKVWILHGTLDAKVIAGVTDLLKQQYETWVASDNVKYIKDKPFSHVFPTLSEGVPCMASEAPFIGQCDYDAAGEILTYLYTDLSQPDDSLTGKLVAINQRELAGSSADTMAETGYAYIPQACKDGETCKVHVSFHGCNQFADAVGTAYAEKTGFNRWADDNNLAVVYPQTKKSLFMPLNPQGCWDWWGYTGDNYATKDGAQIKAVTAILNGLNTRASSEVSE